MKILEKILAIVALISIGMVYLEIPGGILMAIISLSTLSGIYYSLGFAFFNGIRLRQIFSMESYIGVSTWQIGGAIFTGLALSVLILGILFSIANYPGSIILLILGLFSTGLVLILVAFNFIGGNEVFYKRILTRSSIIGLSGVIILWISLC